MSCTQGQKARESQRSLTSLKSPLQKKSDSLSFRSLLTAEALLINTPVPWNILTKVFEHARPQASQGESHSWGQLCWWVLQGPRYTAGFGEIAPWVRLQSPPPFETPAWGQHRAPWSRHCGHFGHMLPCRGGCPVHCRMCSNFPALYLLNARNSPSPGHDKSRLLGGDSLSRTSASEGRSGHRCECCLLEFQVSRFSPNLCLYLCRGRCACTPIHSPGILPLGSSLKGGRTLCRWPHQVAAHA